MKIQPQALQAYSRTAQAPATQGTPSPGTRSAAPAAAGVKQDEAAQVSVSPEARALAAKSQAPFNQQKVDALRSQIADGKFVVNSQILAMRLLDKLA